MIKLLALDLDGTLLNSQGKIPEKNLNAIRQAEEAGVLVTIATGRRFRDARPVGIEAGLNAPLITHNGALLKFAQSGETVAFSLLSKETAAEVVRVGKALGGDALVSADPHGVGSMYYDCVSEENLPLRKYISWSKRLHGKDAENSVVHVENLQTTVPKLDVIHISFSGGCDSMARMQTMLDAQLNGLTNLLATVYPKLDFTLLDILPLDASKGVGLEKLAATNGLTAKNVMAIGDNFNDLEMLEFAGTPVVMGNADPSLLERTEFYTTLSNDEGGVADAIKRFILND
ncbi:MAG: Cof-type HAD-IIB family hydrolase [Pyrinomonadaceae bacterium]